MLSSSFRRREGLGDCAMLKTPDEVRELQRELYQKAKQELRKPLEEDDRKAVFGKTERTV
jgi:hypothetical protein